MSHAARRMSATFTGRAARSEIRAACELAVKEQGAHTPPGSAPHASASVVHSESEPSATVPIRHPTSCEPLGDRTGRSRGRRTGWYKQNRSSQKEDCEIREPSHPAPTGQSPRAPAHGTRRGSGTLLAGVPGDSRSPAIVVALEVLLAGSSAFRPTGTGYGASVEGEVRIVDEVACDRLGIQPPQLGGWNVASARNRPPSGYVRQGRRP